MARPENVKPNLGHLIDRIWSLVPSDHELRNVRMGDPKNAAQTLWMAGRLTLDHCAKLGASTSSKLTDDDHNTWLRLVGAWVLKMKDGGALPTRAEVASAMGMDASSITNFINGKRPLTLNAQKCFADFLDVNCIHIRPDMGTKYAEEIEESTRRKFKLISDHVDGLERTIRDHGASDQYSHNLIRQVDDLKLVLAQG
ncbi:helix-turn-helix domain-containing protein [Pseudomonas aeruginosa]